MILSIKKKTSGIWNIIAKVTIEFTTKLRYSLADIKGWIWSVAYSPKNWREVGTTQKNANPAPIMARLNEVVMIDNIEKRFILMGNAGSINLSSWYTIIGKATNMPIIIDICMTKLKLPAGEL